MVEIEQAWNQRGDDDSQLLAKDLVQREKLTRYQAAAIYQGKTRGLVLNDYVVLDKLGSGGMGNVYKARHRVNGAVVAIKVMSSASTRSADNVKRFQREPRWIARLNHPNIVRAIEAGRPTGCTIFAMEFVTGSTCRTISSSAVRFRISKRFSVSSKRHRARLRSCAGDCASRHQAGQFVSVREWHGQLLDMGLARLNDPADAAAAQAHEGLTQTGQVMGTVDYMAPDRRSTRDMPTLGPISIVSVARCTAL